jgi:predicted regulator of Ras-like GTPase activity (Roadblock/LC7/MglB family)
MGVKENLEKVLSELKNVNGVEGYAFVREDGLPLINNLEKDIDLINLCSSCASINQSGNTLKNFNSVIIEYTEGNNLLIRKTDEETLLVCLTSKNANLSEILEKMKNLTKQIKMIIS